MTTLRRFSLWRLYCLLLLMALALGLPATSCAATSSARMPTPGPTPPPTTTPYPYGVVYAYPAATWHKEDRPAIAAHLAALRNLGVNTVVQTFSTEPAGTDHAANWLILLDEADALDITVIARPWPVPNTGGAEDITIARQFLAVTGNHPALGGYLGLHEPLEQLTSRQLQQYYLAVKTVAPSVPIAHYLGDIAYFHQNPNFPNRDFGPRICDICIIWYYPFRYLNDAPVFEADIAQERLQANRALVNRLSPASQLWFLGQTYAQPGHPRQLRMPSAAEMDSLFQILWVGHANGFLWYPWAFGKSYSQTLSSPNSKPQQKAVQTIYNAYLTDTEATNDHYQP